MKITAFTGSGISAASGIPTYRAAGSGWDEYAHGIAHANRYGNHLPELWGHWTQMARNIAAADPNPAHIALAKYGATIITQNVDGLHQRAGSETVIELHGDMSTMRCLRCKKNSDCDISTTSPVCSHCGSKRVRTNAILFGEQLSTRKFKDAEKAIGASDLVVVVGTSGTVYPAKNLVTRSIARGKHTVLFDMQNWMDTAPFSEVILGECDKTLPKYLDAYAFVNDWMDDIAGKA